jgi:hypothetical protein
MEGQPKLTPSQVDLNPYVVTLSLAGLEPTTYGLKGRVRRSSLQEFYPAFSGDFGILRSTESYCNLSHSESRRFALTRYSIEVASSRAEGSTRRKTVITALSCSDLAPRRVCGVSARCGCELSIPPLPHHPSVAWSL